MRGQRDTLDEPALSVLLAFRFVTDFAFPRFFYQEETITAYSSGGQLYKKSSANNPVM
jgi:hypothetical protein